MTKLQSQGRPSAPHQGAFRGPAHWHDPDTRAYTQRSASAELRRVLACRRGPKLQLPLLPPQSLHEPKARSFSWTYLADSQLLTWVHARISQREIARRLGTTHSNVKWRLARIRKVAEREAGVWPNGHGHQQKAP